MEMDKEANCSGYARIGNTPSVGTVTVSSSDTNGWWSIESCQQTVGWPYQQWVYPYGGISMNNTDKAFQVAKKLMEDKLVICKTPDEFIKLVEVIAKAL